MYFLFLRVRAINWLSILSLLRWMYPMQSDSKGQKKYMFTRISLSWFWICLFDRLGWVGFVFKLRINGSDALWSESNRVENHNFWLDLGQLYLKTNLRHLKRSFKLFVSSPKPNNDFFSCKLQITVYILANQI